MKWTCGKPRRKFPAAWCTFSCAEKMAAGPWPDSRNCFRAIRIRKIAASFSNTDGSEKMAAGPWPDSRNCFRAIRIGKTCCNFTNISTATPAPASAPITRPAGPASSPNFWNRAVSNAAEIQLRRVTLHDADILLRMMRALEESDPGLTPFDEARRRFIFQQFVADTTYGCVWFIEEAGQLAGYVILTVG